MTLNTPVACLVCQMSLVDKEKLVSPPVKYAIDSVPLHLSDTCMVHYVTQTPYKVFISALYPLYNSCWADGVE